MMWPMIGGSTQGEAAHEQPPANKKADPAGSYAIPHPQRHTIRPTASPRNDLLDRDRAENFSWSSSSFKGRTPIMNGLMDIFPARSFFRAATRPRWRSNFNRDWRVCRGSKRPGRTIRQTQDGTKNPKKNRYLQPLLPGSYRRRRRKIRRSRNIWTRTV